MPTFTVKEIEKYRQLSGKIQELPIAKTLLEDKNVMEKDFLLQIPYTLLKLKIDLK